MRIRIATKPLVSILSSTKYYANNNNGNKRIFQTTLNANETVQLFFSHYNRTGSNLNYAIMIFNPNASSSTANITATNIGYDRGWNTAEFTPWVDFYAGKSKSLQVKGQKTGFLLDWRSIVSSDAPFRGIMRISSNSTVTLTVYVWEGNDTSVIDGNESQYECMGLSTSTLNTAYKWNCFEVTVAANKKETITFQFSHATCSSSPIYMQWT